MLVIILLIILSLIVRISFFNFQTGDYLYNLLPWTDFIKGNAYFSSLKAQFSNYTPPYLYILVLISYLPIPSLYAIKIVSIIFDFVLAYFVMLIVRDKYKNKLISWSSFLITFCAPTVMLNGALWAQCDSIYSSGIIAMIYYLIKKRWGRALLSFSIAFAIKLQAIFLFPLLILMFLKEKGIRKFFVLIPFIYLLLILPNYFLGRSFIDLLTIYLNYQVNDNYGFLRLTLNAPNLYQYIPNEWAYFFITVGLFFAASVIFFLIIYINTHINRINKDIVIKLSLIFSLIVPFVLPKMHERYFYMADIISIVYAFYFPRFFYVPVIVITASTLSYLPYLFGTWVNFQFLALSLLAVIIVVLKDFFKRKD